MSKDGSDGEPDGFEWGEDRVGAATDLAVLAAVGRLESEIDDFRRTLHFILDLVTIQSAPPPAEPEE